MRDLLLLELACSANWVYFILGPDKKEHFLEEDQAPRAGSVWFRGCARTPPPTPRLSIRDSTHPSLSGN